MMINDNKAISENLVVLGVNIINLLEILLYNLFLLRNVEMK